MNLSNALAEFFQSLWNTRIESAERLQTFDIHAESSCVQFTLPNVHRFFTEDQPEFKSLTYKEFRQGLFNSPINERLKEIDAEIVITDNQRKVDLSSYAIQLRHPTTD
ncbi:hypothetical protein [Litoribacillus peritrichatus]|uniref:Uncharacterized protein n=1 Tax=Litoribacillus peritrichatus TaxID=718191 RepID=A0ABP7MEH9_9GAMM